MNIKQLKYRKRTIIESIKDTGDLMRGSIFTAYRKCGKKNCYCYKSTQRHPIMLLTLYIKKKQKCISIPRHKIKEIKKLISEYQKLWNKIDDLTEINLKILKRTGK